MTGQSPVIKLRLVSGLLPGVYQEVMNHGKPDRAWPSHPGLGISGEPRPREAHSKKEKTPCVCIAHGSAIGGIGRW